MILDAAGTPLGVARRRPGRFSWLARAPLEICEADDEPLLFTVRPRWALLPRWEVRDADSHRVGGVRGAWVFDRFGLPLAAAEPSAGRGQARFRDREGRVLAALDRSPEGTHLQFDGEAPANPFVRMILLAAALLVPPGP